MERAIEVAENVLRKLDTGFNLFLEDSPRRAEVVVFKIKIAAHCFTGVIEEKNLGLQVRLFSGVYLDKKVKRSQTGGFLLRLLHLSAYYVFFKYAVDERNNEIVCQASIIADPSGLTEEQCEIALKELIDGVEESWREAMASYHLNPDRYLDMGEPE